MAEKKDKLKLHDLLKKVNRDLEEAAQEMTSLVACSDDDLLDITSIIKDLRDLRQKVQSEIDRRAFR